MAKKLFSKILGFYVPAFFEMHVDTNSMDMTINKLSARDRTILFHEYIHYLQDFSTYYGLNRIYTYSEFIHSIVNRICKSPDKTFKVPYILEDNEDNVFLNQYIVSKTLGNNSAEIKSFELDSEPEIKVEDIDFGTEKLQIPEVIIHTETNEERTFGAIAIMESMAYIMEKCCSPKDFKPSPEYPYAAAEKIANFYVPKFSSDLLMVLALCDMSLQNSNPGVTFVNVMKGIKSGRLIFTKPEDIYDYFYLQKTKNVYGGETDFLTAYLKLLNIVINQLKSYIHTQKIGRSYYEWLDTLAAFAMDWRINDRYFLLEMARQDDLSNNGCWGKAICEVGTPLMRNNFDYFFKISPSGMTEGENVEYFKAIRQIEELFSDGKIECDMYSWCNVSPEATPNDLCKTTPWQKCGEERLCPYAFLWKHWGLMGYEPKF